jgi:bifunctional non-homologous end joining protein LigD
MLATLVDKAFDAANWFYEVKWDGYRALAFIEKGNVQLLSRNNKSFNDKYYPITQLLKNWKIDAVLDGEIVVLNEKGISDFSSLQNWRSEVDGELTFFIFYLLWYEGKSLMEIPFIERHAVLKQIFPTSDDRLRLSEVFDTNGIEFLKAATKLGLEGIIAKMGSSTYIPDSRSKEWLKIKASKRQEVVIGGFTKNENTSKQFSSLLLGVFENGRFEYAGKVGTGFSDKSQKEMMVQFKPLIIKNSPFESEPDVNQPSRFRPKPVNVKATWLKPKLVCEIAFSEVTKDGVFRHPSFKGMRMDKDASEVIREAEIPTDNIIQDMEKPKRKEKTSRMGSKDDSASNEKDKLNSLVKAPKSDSVKTLLNPKEETQVKKLNGHELKFTNLSKVYWPEDGITKRDMFNYYYQVADYILPYLEDRPQSLNRFPNGIHGASFYQKDVKGKAPDWVETFPYTTSEGEKKEYLVGKDEATLLWMASLGCIEMNPWFSRVQTPDNPDYCIIDLDPDKNTFDQVIQAALAIKEVLDEVNVPCYCKTSGSTGMHIYIPLEAKVSYDQSQLFAKLIVNVIHEQLPEFTSLERMVKNRKGKMYLDFLQNRPGATIACPYSLRPKPGATVSMPLAWDEVKPGLKMKDFTIKNTTDRVRTEGDPFKGVLGKGIDLKETLEKFHSVFNIS